MHGHVVQGTKNKLFLALSVLFLLIISSCAPLGTGASAANCRDGSGNPINLRTPFGKWKKISGYESPRSSAELELFYDVMVIEYGAVMCAAEIINGQQGPALYQAAYEHFVDDKEIELTYLAGETFGSQEGFSYSFSGPCSDTTMTLTSLDNTSIPQVFRLISKNVQQGDCQLQID